jgi:hypothetical protein
MSQFQDQVIDNARRWVRIKSPDLVEQCLASEHALRILNEEFQKLKLASGQDNRNPIPSNGHSLEVNFATRESINGRWRGLPPSPDSRLNARCKLTRAKGLGHIIIGTQLEKQYLIGNIRDCAKDDDRYFARMALEPLAELTTRDSGKDQVQQHCQRSLAVKQLQSGFTVSGNNGCIELSCEDSP